MLEDPEAKRLLKRHNQSMTGAFLSFLACLIFFPQIGAATSAREKAQTCALLRRICPECNKCSGESLCAPLRKLLSLLGACILEQAIIACAIALFS